MMIIRDSIRARYTFLPFWYTLFFQANQTGNPMMRPLWYEFPTDTSTFAMDSSFMIGSWDFFADFWLVWVIECVDLCCRRRSSGAAGDGREWQIGGCLFSR